jgi:hypothetical protein
VPGGSEHPAANITSAKAWTATAFARNVITRKDDVCLPVTRNVLHGITTA